MHPPWRCWLLRTRSRSCTPATVIVRCRGDKTLRRPCEKDRIDAS
jgi:hypothetical protein